MELRSLADRNLHGDHFGRQLLFDLIEDALEIRVLLVHQGHEKHARQPASLGVVPHLLGPDFDTGARGQHDDGGVGRVNARERVTGEVQVPGSVDEVDFRVHPLGDGQREIDGVFAFDFVSGVIGEGGPILD